MIVLVTGSTDGVGKQTALELAQCGHSVYLHGRREELVQKVTKELTEKTGNSNLKGFTGDFISLEEVRLLASSITAETDKLDVLINNAGILNRQFALSQDGFEQTFAVNHLAPFLLTNLLLGILKNGHSPRIINVSSDVHSRELDIPQLQERGGYDGVKEYSISKLCNILFTYKLARDLQKYGITSNCLHPGMINTKMLVETWGEIGESVERGAETSVYLALSDEVTSVTGKYFRNRKEVKSAPISYNTEVQEELWRISQQIIHSVLSKMN